MNIRLLDLAERRRVLLEKIAAQRMAVAEISERWQKPLALADTGLKGVRFILNHPALVSGSVAAFLAWRRKGIAGLAHEGWRLLYLYPLALSSTLKYLSSATRSPSEECKTEIDL